MKALQALNGRWYSGRQINAEYSIVTEFGEASCRQVRERGQGRPVPRCASLAPPTPHAGHGGRLQSRSVVQLPPPADLRQRHQGGAVRQAVSGGGGEAG